MESSPILEAKKRIKQCLKNSDSFLDLSNIDLKSIPELNSLPNLRKLNLSKNHITQIENLDGLTRLFELDLSDNNIEEINNISKLYGLSTLNLTNNQIKKMVVFQKVCFSF